MAERIVSPGVFTRERDLSFLPQAIGEIGAAIIGPTKKGPAFTPTQISNFQEFEEMFGGVDRRFYTPYTVEQYLRSAGVVTIVRVLGIGGYVADALELVAYSATLSASFMSNSGATGIATHSLAILAPSRGGGDGTADIASAFTSASSAAGVTGAGTWTAFSLQVSGSDTTPENYALSFNTSSANYITNVISEDPQSTKSGGNDSSVYVYKAFKQASMIVGDVDTLASASVVLHEGASGVGIDLKNGSTSYDTKGNASTFTGNNSYSLARTPYIQSQLSNGSRSSLFRIYTRSHGSEINSSYKVNILNIKPATDVAGSDFGAFSIQVRVHNPGNIDNDNILEQFDTLTFDPNSPSFFAKRIGDRWVDIDSDGKLTYYGDFVNLSKFIRVGDYADMVEDGVFRFPKSVVPMGFKAVYNTVPGTTNVPSASFRIQQRNASDDFDSTVFYGFKFSSTDSQNYLGPIPNAANVGNNVTMSLENMLGHADASTLASTFADGTELISLTNSAIAQRKFTIPFQW